jgi:hypothetical protein
MYKKVNLYTYHKGIDKTRFDYSNTIAHVKVLQDLGKEVNHINEVGDGQTFFKGISINQGSIIIIQDAESGRFKVIDNGDCPSLLRSLKSHVDFDGAVVGQYNPKVWKNNNNVVPGIYQETYWQYGNSAFSGVFAYRTHENFKIVDKLLWRGSTYRNHPNENYRDIRECVYHIPTDNFDFFPYPTVFDDYIKQAASYKAVLSLGGGGGFHCGDICFRDIEMLGLGIPLLRPKYLVELRDPLIPNVHYISVETEYDKLFKYANPKTLGNSIAKRFEEVKDNQELLDQISTNAREWYLRNFGNGTGLAYTNLESLGL